MREIAFGILATISLIAAISIPPALATSYSNKQVNFCMQTDEQMFHGPVLIDRTTHQQYSIHGFPKTLKAGTCLSLSDTDFGTHIQQGHQYFFYVSTMAKHGHPLSKLIEA